MCPAPKSYRQTNMDDAGDDVYVYEDSDSNDLKSERKPDKEQKDQISVDEESTRSLSSTSSLRSVGGIVQIPTVTTSIPQISPYSSVSKDKKGEEPCLPKDHSKQKPKKTNAENQQQKQYDVKPGAKIFPLHLIRPTLGMNLAKFETKHAKVRIMDLGGSIKMRNLWERYYNDIQGIIFVVDVSQHASVAKLMESRAFYRCMLDDESLKNVPILIFANKADDRTDRDGVSNLSQNGNAVGSINDGDSVNTGRSDDDANSVGNDGGLLGDTSLLDIAELFLSPPRGSPSSNADFNNVALFVGSAKTGEGVKPAFEWLIRMSSYLVKAQRRASVN